MHLVLQPSTLASSQDTLSILQLPVVHDDLTISPHTLAYLFPLQPRPRPLTPPQT